MWIRKVVVGFVVILALGGCGTRPTQGETEGPRGVVLGPGDKDSGAALSPQQQMYQYVREGTNQLQAASESIAEARTEAVKQQKTATGATKTALDEILERIDAAGNGVGEHILPIPEWQEFAADSVRYDNARRNAVTAASDAVTDLRDARGIADDLAASATGAQKTNLESLANLLDVAADDVAEAIRGLGSTPPIDPTAEAEPEAPAGTNN